MSAWLANFLAWLIGVSPSNGWDEFEFV